MIPAFDFFRITYSIVTRSGAESFSVLRFSFHLTGCPPGQPDMLEVPFFKAHLTHFFLSNDVQVYSTHTSLTPP